MNEDPWVCLFHGTKKSLRKYNNTIIPKLLNAAKGVIPKKCLELESPTIKEWCQRVEYIYNMEYIGSRVEEQSEEYMTKWSTWKKFKESGRYMEECS